MPHGDGATGGGIFALRRPRPYSRALAGRTLRGALRSKCRPRQPKPSGDNAQGREAGSDGMRAWWGKRAGESSRCEDPAPTVGLLRGCHCGAHYDPNAAIYASPMHAHTIPPGRPTVVITSRHGKGGHSRVGGQLAACPYSTTPTKNTTADFAN